MKKLIELRQQKTALKNQMRSLLEKADSENRSLNDDEGKQFDELRAKADSLDTEISTQKSPVLKLLRMKNVTSQVFPSKRKSPKTNCALTF